MIQLSRRALLLGGAVVVGAGVAGAAAVGAGRALTAAPSATPSPSTPRAPLRPSPTPSPGIVPVTQFGEPTLIASIRTTTSQNVMQQFQLDGSGTGWITQSVPRTGQNRYSTVVARCTLEQGSATSYAEVDAMTVVDGGHGLGLAVQARDGAYDVWISLQGDAEQRDPDGGRLARFRYTPGTYTIDAIPGGVQYAKQLPNARGELQEAIYSFDWAAGMVVERMYDFHTFHGEQHTRRRIADLLAGVDRPLGRIVLPVDPPTMQGFTTVDDAFYRWVGAGNAGSGSPAAENPMALEQYDWRTGRLIGRRAFPTLGQGADGTWPGGAYEPEGCAVLRDPDGTASLLVGVSTGTGPDRRGLVYRFAGIAA